MCGESGGACAQEAEKGVEYAENRAAEGYGSDIDRRAEVTHQHHVDQTEQRDSYVADNVWDG